MGDIDFEGFYYAECNGVLLGPFGTYQDCENHGMHEFSNIDNFDNNRRISFCQVKKGQLAEYDYQYAMEFHPLLTLREADYD